MVTRKGDVEHTLPFQHLSSSIVITSLAQYSCGSTIIHSFANESHSSIDVELQARLVARYPPRIPLQTPSPQMPTRQRRESLDAPIMLDYGVVLQNCWSREEYLTAPVRRTRQPDPLTANNTSCHASRPPPRGGDISIGFLSAYIAFVSLEVDDRQSLDYPLIHSSLNFALVTVLSPSTNRLYSSEVWGRKQPVA